MAFNANDEVLAIAEKNGSILLNDRGIYNTGTVQLFKKDSVGNWITTPQSILASNNPATGNAVGYTMAFSLDNTLVVGELKSASLQYDLGIVHTFDTSLLN